MNLQDRLKEIKSRCEAATSGPWKKVSDLPRYAISYNRMDIVPSTNRLYRDGQRPHEFGLYELNADFIAHSRTDVPMLLEMIEFLLPKLDPEFWIDKNKLDTIEEIMEKHTNE